MNEHKNLMIQSNYNLNFPCRVFLTISYHHTFEVKKNCVNLMISSMHVEISFSSVSTKPELLGFLLSTIDVPLSLLATLP